MRDLARERPLEPRWLVVADTNVYVRALTGHPDGPNRKIIEAATLGVIVLVISKEIQDEVLDVLCRDEPWGMGREAAEDLMEPICESARTVECAPDAPHYARATRDPDDAVILRTAAGIYSHEDLSATEHRYIVSGDRHAFPPNRDWYGFKHVEARPFYQALTKGRPL